MTIRPYDGSYDQPVSLDGVLSHLIPGAHIRSLTFKRLTHKIGKEDVWTFLMKNMYRLQHISNLKFVGSFQDLHPAISYVDEQFTKHQLYYKPTCTPYLPNFVYPSHSTFDFILTGLTFSGQTLPKPLLTFAAFAESHSS